MNSTSPTSLVQNYVYFNKRFPKIDARLIVLFGNLSLILISKIFYDMQRSWSQILLTMFTSLIAELFLFQITHKYKSQKFSDRIPSCLTESISCLVLCRSITLWIHPLLITIAILSKYLIRNVKNEHIFNPTNIAVIYVLCFVSNSYFEFRVDDFAFSPYPLFHVTIIGIIATYLANVWKVALSYFLVAIISGGILTNYHELMLSIFPEIGSASLIFGWLMITDPKSAPRSNIGQIAFGSLIALTHIILRYNNIVYSRFISLFIITALFYFYNHFKNENV